MNLLEKVKKMRGAEAALGLTFANHGKKGFVLPKGARLLAYSDNTYFCFFQHYEETVFAVTEDDTGWVIRPIAYNFPEFLRLIAACGCAELCARSLRLPEETFLTEQDAQWRRYPPALRILRETFDIIPIDDPYRYTHTVGQIIDCGRIGRK